MNAASTVAPRAHAIDPKVFLDYFAECGGGYCLTPDRQLWLGILQTGTSNADRVVAAQIMREVKPSDAERIKAYLIARENGESELADNWSAAMTRCRIAEEAYAAFRPLENPDSADDARKGDELATAQAEAERYLMAMPAPDRTALLWKLELLLKGDGESIEIWDLNFVAQTVADMRRLLVEG
jgi:hypothetical protein